MKKRATQTNLNKLWSIILSVTLVTGLLPTAAFATPREQWYSVTEQEPVAPLPNDEGDGSASEEPVQGSDSLDAEFSATPEKEPEDLTSADANSEGEDADTPEGANVYQIEDLYAIDLYGEAAFDKDTAIRAVEVALEADETLELPSEEIPVLVDELFETTETASDELEAQEALAAFEEHLQQNQPIRYNIRNMAATLQTANAPATSAVSHANPYYPREGDGSEIDSITLQWLPSGSQELQDSEYTLGEGDDAETYYVKDSRLYINAPANDSDMRVKFQLDYALSGEKNYAPGDVTITIPAYIFHQRTANNQGTEDASKDPADYGAFLSPMLPAPDRRNDFNWQLVEQDGELVYVFTNTRTMTAATRGFIQFQISGLTPHSIIDMQVSDYLQATMEVTTHRENTIALDSNALTAQINTFQEVRSATKSARNDSPKIIEASDLSSYGMDLQP